MLKVDKNNFKFFEIIKLNFKMIWSYKNNLSIMNEPASDDKHTVRGRKPGKGWGRALDTNFVHWTQEKI